MEPLADLTPPPHRPLSGRAWRWWRPACYVVGLALAGLAVWTVSGKTSELSGASTYLAHVGWGWVGLAVAAEIASYLCLAGLQRRLLRAGDVEVRLPPMAAVTVAGNAVQNTLPAGVVLSAAYFFRQYRRYGADDILAGWMVVTVGIVSFASLTVIAAAGAILALSSASALDLVAVIGGLVALAILLVLAWGERAVWIRHGGGLVRLCQRVFRRPHGDADVLLQRWVGHLSAISPSRRDWAGAAALAMANWLTDLGCLTLAFLAIGSGVPWRGLLLAYGAGQLAAILPITPGGLGVVEGSLTVALVAFGGAEASTVAAVLLYRLISFWLVLPVGWGAAAGISLSGRRQTRRAGPPPSPALTPLVGTTEDV